jgi:hypothetical protein
MAYARSTVRVNDDSALREHAFIRDSGAPCAWLDVGEDGALGVWGSPAAMRRLAAGVIAAADAAQGLVDRKQPVDAPVTVAG